MHVAIIMDGNGRWAEQRGLPRTAGHRAGTRAVRRIVETAVREDVDVLTLYAFSSDNWSRPPDEVANLMWLFKRTLQSEVARCIENGVRIKVIGRRDRLNRGLLDIIEQAERVTAAGSRLQLQLAVDYSSHEAIMRAAEAVRLGCRDAGREDATDRMRRFEHLMLEATHSSLPTASVDLLIRTGGEQRLSDFLLWECAYAELVFVETLWPDMDEQAFRDALAEFARRERRFGGLPRARKIDAVGETR